VLEAAHWPYEVYVMPRTCVLDLADLSPEDRAEMMGL
jgi:galactose-1-phosphate uridylyltransferase